MWKKKGSVVGISGWKWCILKLRNEKKKEKKKDNHQLLNKLNRLNRQEAILNDLWICSRGILKNYSLSVGGSVGFGEYNK